MTLHPPTPTRRSGRYFEAHEPAELGGGSERDVVLVEGPIAIEYVAQTLSAAPARHALPRLVVRAQLDPEQRAALAAVSEVVLDPLFARLLPDDELAVALQAPNRADLVVGVRYLQAVDALLLFTGTLDQLLIPGHWVRATSLPTAQPLALADAHPIDYGHTLAVADLEIATDAVLYEFDAQARRRMKRRLRNQQAGVGASIRRLRLQRGLRQADLAERADLSRRQVGRIERGLASTPTPASLARIARALNTSADLLPTF